MAIDAANLSGTSVHCALDQRLQLSESRTPRHVLPVVVGEGNRVVVGFNVVTCSCAVVAIVAAAVDGVDVSMHVPHMTGHFKRMISMALQDACPFLHHMASSSLPVDDNRH